MKIFKYTFSIIFLFIILFIHTFPVNAQDITSGLVGYWNFDEGTGNIAGDSSGNNNGTLVNMDSSTDWVDGKIGQALDFDGTDDYVLVNNSASLDFGTGSNFTYSVWVKNRSIQSSGSKFVEKDYTGNKSVALLHAYSSNNLPSFRVRDSNNIELNLTATTLVNDNVWHHIVGVKVGSNAYIYVDGIQEGFASKSWNGNWNYGDVYIGTSRIFGARFTDGLIDEVRIYNRALTQADVTELFNFTGGIVGGGGSDCNGEEWDYSVVSVDTTKIFIFASTIAGLLAVLWVIRKTVGVIRYNHDFD